MKFWSLLLILLASPAINAFTFNTSSGAHFYSDEVRVFVADHNCDEISLRPQDLVGMVEQAVDQYWNQVPTSKLRLISGGVVTRPSAFATGPLCSSLSGGCTPNPDLQGPSDIVISCNQNTDPGMFTSVGILALSAPNNTQGKQIVSSVVLLNNIPGSLFGEKTRDEQVAVIAHELGHAIGLGHSPVEDSLMFFRSVPTRRRLGQDDRDGVTYLYPQELGPSTCGTLPPSGGGADPLKRTLLTMLLMIGLALQGLKKLVPRR